MTPDTPGTNPPPAPAQQTVVVSFAQRALSAEETLMAQLTGLAILFASLGLAVHEEFSPPEQRHTARLILFGIGAVLGAVIAVPALTFPLVQKLVVLVGPYTPWHPKAPNDGGNS